MNVEEAAAIPPAPIPPAPIESIWVRAKRWIRYAKIVGCIVAVLLGIILVVEAVHLYQVAYDLNPVLGYVTLAGMAGAALLVFIPVYRFLDVPRALKPPVNPPAGEIETKHLKAELRFLDRYLENCAVNPAFEEKLTEIRAARVEIDAMRRKLGVVGAADLDREIGEWVMRSMGGILRDIDERADRMIYQEALAVGLGTAASPNGTLDAFVMLWRSVTLASKLAILYYGRPGPLGILAICRDVSVAMISAAYLNNFSDSLGAVLTKTVGGVAGVVAGPAVEGVTNSLVLIRIGHVTKERCRSFRYWNQTQQRSAVIKALRATQRVAFGLTNEIFRQVGTGLGAMAGSAARGLTSAAEAAAEGISNAAGAAAEGLGSAAAGIGEKISSIFGGWRTTRPPGEEPEEEETDTPAGGAT